MVAICVPFMVLLMPLFFVAAGVFTCIDWVWRPIAARRVRAELMARGRCVSWEDLEAELARVGAADGCVGSGGEEGGGVDVGGGRGRVLGTLLRNSTAAGWPDFEVWWVRGESVRACAELEEGIDLPIDYTAPGGKEAWLAREEDPRFDRWCRARYFDLDTGKGLLVESGCSNGGWERARARMDAVLSRFPGVETISADTWICEMADDGNEERERARLRAEKREGRGRRV